MSDEIEDEELRQLKAELLALKKANTITEIQQLQGNPNESRISVSKSKVSIYNGKLRPEQPFVALKKDITDKIESQTGIDLNQLAGVVDGDSPEVVYAKKLDWLVRGGKKNLKGKPPIQSYYRK